MAKESKNYNLSSPKFESAVFFVKDVEKSKNFYVNFLGQKILMDFGRNVGFEGGFAIWETDYALNIIFEEKSSGISVGGNNAEEKRAYRNNPSNKRASMGSERF